MPNHTSRQLVYIVTHWHSTTKPEPRQLHRQPGKVDARLLTDLMTLLKALTFATLCSLPLRWSRSASEALVRDLIACLSCLVLHIYELPSLSLSFAIAYSVWMLLPGSLDSLNLPKYAQFMQSVTIAQHADEECKVCWDTAHPLARLSCGHLCCIGCLKLMYKHFQTACPMCRIPLFSTNDRIILVVAKASVACASVNMVLHVLMCIHELQTAHYFGALFSLSFSCGLGWYISATYVLVGEFGDNWWRGTAGTVGPDPMTLQSACIALGTGSILLCQTLWTTRAIAY